MIITKHLLFWNPDCSQRKLERATGNDHSRFWEQVYYQKQWTRPCSSVVSLLSSIMSSSWHERSTAGSNRLTFCDTQLVGCANDWLKRVVEGTPVSCCTLGKKSKRHRVRTMQVNQASRCVIWQVLFDTHYSYIWHMTIFSRMLNKQIN